jgi:hypothetical protein
VSGPDLKDIERRILLGDSVTTRELRAAHSHFYGLREMLGKLGQRWHFAFQEAIRLEQMCRQYLDARKERI